MDEKGVNKYTGPAIKSSLREKEGKSLIMNLKSYIWNGQRTLSLFEKSFILNITRHAVHDSLG
ncbi:hypothetical protein SAMN05216311_105368 [Chitinophaga sp. CF418]|nr:hypothetical protein SAMN05216311_105368 [Chitinophaga sp. CF418]